jgi:hypothetical protein
MKEFAEYRFGDCGYDLRKEYGFDPRKFSQELARSVARSNTILRKMKNESICWPGWVARSPGGPGWVARSSGSIDTGQF